MPNQNFQGQTLSKRPNLTGLTQGQMATLVPYRLSTDSKTRDLVILR